MFFDSPSYSYKKSYSLKKKTYDMPLMMDFLILFQVYIINLLSILFRELLLDLIVYLF